MALVTIAKKKASDEWVVVGWRSMEFRDAEEHGFANLVTEYRVVFHGAGSVAVVHSARECIAQFRDLPPVAEPRSGLAMQAFGYASRAVMARHAISMEIRNYDEFGAMPVRRDSPRRGIKQPLPNDQFPDVRFWDWDRRVEGWDA